MLSNETTIRPAVFLTDYASYNNGSQFQFGHWVNLDDFSDADEFMQYVSDHLKECDRKSPLDEYTKREEPMFTDFEGFPEYLYSESMSLEDCEKIFLYIEADDVDDDVLEWLTDQCNMDFEEAIDALDNVYVFEGDLSDYAYEVMNDCHDIPEHLAGYIDYEAYGRDLEINGDVVELSTDKYITNAYEFY